MTPASATAVTLPEGPSYEDACVLRLREQPCSTTDHANLAVLTAVSALEMHAPLGAGEDGDPRSQEFQHLDNKLNVLIQMFAGFWRQQCELPEPVAVTMSAAGLRFAAQGVEVPDTVRSVELYLNDALPQALVLPVAECAVDAQGLQLRFDALSEELEDALSRHIFRRHRRAVAQTRQASNLHSPGE